MLRKFTIFTVCALLSIASFTTGCSKKKIKIQSSTGTEESFSKKLSTKTPQDTVESFLKIDVSTSSGLADLKRLVTPDYEEFLYGKKIADYNSIFWLEKIAELSSTNNADVSTERFLNLLDDDRFAKPFIETILAVSSSTQDWQTMRQQIKSKISNSTPEQKQTFHNNIKKTFDNLSKHFSSLSQYKKIIEPQIQDDTALVTIILPPRNGREVKINLHLKHIDGEWLIAKSETLQ